MRSQDITVAQKRRNPKAHVIIELHKQISANADDDDIRTLARTAIEQQIGPYEIDLLMRRIRDETMYDMDEVMKLFNVELMVLEPWRASTASELARKFMKANVEHLHGDGPFVTVDEDGQWFEAVWELCDFLPVTDVPDRISLFCIQFGWLGMTGADVAAVVEACRYA